MFSFILSSICDVNLWAKTPAGQVSCTKDPLLHCQASFSSLFLKLVSYFSSFTPQEVSSGCVLCPALWLAPCRGPNLATQWADLFSKPPPAGRLYERPFKSTQKHRKVHLYAFIWNREEKLDCPMNRIPFTLHQVNEELRHLRHVSVDFPELLGHSKTSASCMGMGLILFPLTHTHTHACWFLWFTGTLHRRNGFYTVQTVCAIALHLSYT